MKRDTSLFSPDLIIEVSGEEMPVDTSHIYSGEIFGKFDHFYTPHPGWKGKGKSNYSNSNSYVVFIF